MWRAASHGAAALVYAAATITAAHAAGPEEKGLQPALLEVTVNALAMGDPVLVQRGPAGDVYVPREALAAWRLKLASPRTVAFEGRSFVALDGAKGLDFTLTEDTQRLDITAAPDLLEASDLSIDADDAGPMTRSGRGAFLNYEFLGERAGSDTRLSGAFELGIFGGGGFGIGTFIGDWDAGGASLTRLDTNWTIDDPGRRRSFRLGDGVTRGGIGGAPVRFGGVQYGSNFAVDPGFLTLPLPTVGGSAALPSVVDIYVNNTLRDSREVAPGPFSVIDIPVVTGRGDVQLIVRDLLGRETLITQSYYAAPQLLRRGLHDFSYEAGLLRYNYARKSSDYGEAVISGTHRYGFTDDLTGEAHVEATLDVQSAGVSASVLLPGLGLLEAQGAASNGADGGGGLMGLSFERRTQGFSFGARSEFTTRRYANVGSHRGREPAAKTIQLYAGMPVAFGSIGASYLLRDGRGEPDAELLSANASVGLGRLGTLHLAARKSFQGEKDAAVELFLTVPIGARTSASAGVVQGSQGTSATADLQRNLPAGEGVGYRVSAATGGVDRINARLSVQTLTGTYEAQLTWSDGRTGMRFVAGGAIALVDGAAFASRRLTQSFAKVQVGNFKDVRIYSDNQLVGRTNANGVAIVPRLRPFERNVIRLELADLPIDTRLAGGERSVRPHDRSGVAVDFGAVRARGAMLSVRLQDGAALPAGAIVRLDGNAEAFVTAPGGQLYLTGLEARNVARASWGERTCRFTFGAPETDDPQPDLGQFTCAAT